MAEPQPVGLVLHGERVEGWLDTDTGQFSLTVADTTVYADNVKDLRNKALAALRKSATKVEVPFTMTTHRGMKHGVATGLHGGNDNVLVRWNGKGGSEQLSSYDINTSSVYRPLTTDEQDKLATLRRIANEAANELHEWQAAHKLDLRKAVADAVAQVMAGKEAT